MKPARNQGYMMIGIALIVTLSVLIVEKISHYPTIFVSNASPQNSQIIAYDGFKIDWQDISLSRNQATSKNYIIKGGICFIQAPGSGSSAQLEFTKGGSGKATVPISVPSKARCKDTNENWIPFSLVMRLDSCPMTVTVYLVERNGVPISQPIELPASIIENSSLGNICGSQIPTSAPTSAPTTTPTSAPTTTPTSAPTSAPTTTPTSAPTLTPLPTDPVPTRIPTLTYIPLPTATPRPTTPPTPTVTATPTLIPTTTPTPTPEPNACSPLDAVITKTMSMQTPDMTTWNWESGIALVGLMKAYETTKDPKILAYVESWMDREVALLLNKTRACKTNQQCYPRCSDADGWWSKSEEDRGVLHPNHAGPGWALMMLYSYKQKPEYKELLDELVSFLDTRACKVGGTIAHFPHQVWDDTLPMIVPLLSLYGKHFQQPQYIDKAMQEYLNHAKLLNPNNQLWYHGWDETENCRACAYWSRGNSWILLSGIELLKSTPESNRLRDTLERSLMNQINATVQYQNPQSKLWHTLIDEPSFFEEVSGSAGIAAALLQSRDLYSDNYSDYMQGEMIMKAGKEALISICTNQVATDGTVLNVSTGTGFPPLLAGKLKYNLIPHDTIKPYGQGLFLIMASDGQYNPSMNPPKMDYPSIDDDIQRADINKDGIVNTIDLLMYYDYIESPETFIDTYSLTFDINADNATNALDISVLIKNLGSENLRG